MAGRSGSSGSSGGAGAPEPPREWSEELARRALASAAPDELLTFELVRDEYREDPQRALQAGRGDVPVGFGLDLAALAPVALAVSSAVVGFLVDLFRDAAADAASPALADILRRVLRLPSGNDGGAREDAVGALTAGQAARVLDVATRQGAALGLEPEAASLLAHAIVGALAVEPAH